MTIDATAPIPAVETGFLHLGGVTPDGRSLQINNRYLTLDGKPWLPVMGELHYTRIPENEWEAEILKMKAAGVDVISTYVFWIHHEEVEGQFDWSGRRNLRAFVQLCARHGMYVYIRPGPWAHGEVRNGGFPDWLNSLPNLRTNDPLYLSHVAQFFNQIGVQLKGLMWKDGGPVIGAQLENEYPLHGTGQGAEHILRLKQLAIAAGIDPPLFSVTGWPSLDFPAHEVVPVSGGYPDGFWFGSKSALPPSMNYLFNFNRALGDMGATVPSTDPMGKVDLTHDPYLAAEEGGGMATSYHRRPVLSADDIAALTLVGLGSGVNLYGYYMFHGGINPQGQRTTLQESQATGYPNDLPQLDYDFQAPIGAFGEIRESYRKTRLLHLFLQAWGSQLAPMPAVGPAQTTARSAAAAAADTSAPRVAVRTDGKSGFAFVNNYVRQLPMPRRTRFQLRVRLPSQDLILPRHPVDIPAGAYFLWPFHLSIQNALLQYSTAQPLTRVDTPNGPIVVFFAIPGIAPEFSFDPATVKTLEAPGAMVTQNDAAWLVENLRPGLNSSVRITDTQGGTATLLLWTKDQAEHCALVQSGKENLLALTQSDLFQDDESLHLRSTKSPVQTVLLMPTATLQEQNVAAAQGSGKVPGPAIARRHIGLWTEFTIGQPSRVFHLAIQPIHPAMARASMKMGPPVAWRDGPVPEAPEDTAFRRAAVWHLKITLGKQQDANRVPSSLDLSGLSELYLKIDYTGDMARLHARGTLLDDDFYNGQPWQVGLMRDEKAVFQTPLELAVLPMPDKAPIYLNEDARRFLLRHPGAQLLGATLRPQYESVLTLTPAI
jgi:hypothetical protein